MRSKKLPKNLVKKRISSFPVTQSSCNCHITGAEFWYYTCMTYPRQQSAQAWAQQLNFAGLEQQHGLPSGVLTRLVHQESRGNCDAVSPAGARGLCQFMPATARGMGVNASDPVSSINGAAKYLEQMMDMFDGNIEKALAAYNYGPGNMRKLLRNHPGDWKSHLPAETRDYIAKVGSGIGLSYRQREEAGTLTGEDREREEARRRGALQEFGIDPNTMGMNEIMGMMFFAIIKSFLEKKFPEAAAEKPITVEPTHVADGTTVTPPSSPAKSAPQTAAERA